jgi:hypothetical protein
MISAKKKLRLLEKISELDARMSSLNVVQFQCEHDQIPLLIFLTKYLIILLKINILIFLLVIPYVMNNMNSSIEK